MITLAAAQRASIGGALFLTVLCGSAWAQSASEGRSQAHKAGSLAAQGKCAPAVVAYTRAFEILKDPVILFNRAECLRKLGREQAALADYERFLQEFPNPPNKALVEQRIAGLRKGPQTGAQAANTNANTNHAGSVQAKPGVLVPKSAPPPQVTVIDDGEKEAEDDEEALVAAPLTVRAWQPPGQAEDAELLATVESSSATREEDKGLSPWIWVGLGAVVVAAGVVAGVLILGNNETDIPESRLGNYKF